VNHDSAEARQQWMICLTDDPTQYHPAPLSAMFQQCWNARYGNDGGGRDFMSPEETPF
jgi:hypothetical protein